MTVFDCDYFLFSHSKTRINSHLHVLRLYYSSLCGVTMLIVVGCASLGCFQCLLFGLSDRTPQRRREKERAVNNVLNTSFFSEQCGLCSDRRDSCLIQTLRGTAGEGGWGVGGSPCLCWCSWFCLFCGHKISGCHRLLPFVYQVNLFGFLTVFGCQMNAPFVTWPSFKCPHTVLQVTLV